MPTPKSSKGNGNSLSSSSTSSSSSSSSLIALQDLSLARQNQKRYVAPTLSSDIDHGDEWAGTVDLRILNPSGQQEVVGDVIATPLSRHVHVVPNTDSSRSSSSSSSGTVHTLPLSRTTAACYSVGHVLNDMTAACWFSYLLLYLERAENLSGSQAGAVLFAGQIADALATPVVGLLSDKSKGFPALGLGRRKIWNAGGAVLVTFCFLGVFGFCLVCSIVTGREPTSTEKTVTYSVFAALFNIGWAAVQVSHMALVPELTADDGERVTLNSARYAFTVLSNVAVFLGMLGILQTAGSASSLSSTSRGDDGSGSGSSSTRELMKMMMSVSSSNSWLGGENTWKSHESNGGDVQADSSGGVDAADPIVYQRLAFVVLGVGCFCTAVFLIGTKEKLSTDPDTERIGKGIYASLSSTEGDENEVSGTKKNNSDDSSSSSYQGTSSSSSSSYITSVAVDVDNKDTFLTNSNTNNKNDDDDDEESPEEEHRRLAKIASRDRRSSSVASDYDGDDYEYEDGSSKNKNKNKTKSGKGGAGGRPDIMTWRDWLVLPAFYQVALVYSLTRLATNISQVYLPFFVTTTLQMNEAAIASTPLLLYVAQLVATILMKKVATRLGRRNALSVGALFVIAACILMLFLQPNTSAGMYFAVILLGIGCAIVMVISVSLEADLVANNTESGAFVYGVCSFADKLFNGAAILAIQTAGVEDDAGSSARGEFIRYVNGLVPLGAAAAAALVTWTIIFPSHLRAQVRDHSAAQSFANDKTSLSAPQPSRRAAERIMKALIPLQRSPSKAALVPGIGIRGRESNAAENESLLG